MKKDCDNFLEQHKEFEKFIESLPPDIQKQKVFLYILELRKRLSNADYDDSSEDFKDKINDFNPGGSKNAGPSNKISNSNDFKNLLKKFENSNSSNILEFLQTESLEIVNLRKTSTVKEKIASLQTKIVENLIVDDKSEETSDRPRNVSGLIKNFEMKSNHGAN